MPHPLQMFYENLTQLGKKSNSVIRSRSVTGSKMGVMCNVPTLLSKYVKLPGRRSAEVFRAEVDTGIWIAFRADNTRGSTATGRRHFGLGIRSPEYSKGTSPYNNGKIHVSAENYASGDNKVRKRLFFGTNYKSSKSRTQGNWLWCHLKGHH